VSDPQARNLISRLLNKDPNKRISLSKVLVHPFVTGKNCARMIGETPIYDVFLSYRVDSDEVHAETIYNLLTAADIKVFWDKKCLQLGIPWEEVCVDNHCTIVFCFADFAVLK
jgi:serine/threonine protein kinase